MGIVEHKDASEAQRQINEINTGIRRTGRLKRWLGMLNNDNAQGEFYITDIIALGPCRAAEKIETVHPSRLSEVEGVNNRLQLATTERVFQSEQSENCCWPA